MTTREILFVFSSRHYRRHELTRLLPAKLILLTCIWVALFAHAIWAQEIAAANTSRYVGAGRWDWTVYLRAPPKVLKEIKCVTYKLHPTFPNPVRKVCELGDARFPFGLSANGWGRFTVEINISFNDGRERQLRHMLSFEAEPKKELSGIRLDNVATKLGDSYWEWTAFIRAPDKVLREVKCVEYHLHPTFPNPVREVCHRGTSTRAFPLTATGWGTFNLKARVYFSDGSVEELTHYLKF
jgi:transcription initiation factor IIF auxiliary subunit